MGDRYSSLKLCEFAVEASDFELSDAKTIRFIERIEKWEHIIPLWFIVLYTGYKRYVWTVNYNRDW